MKRWLAMLLALVMCFSLVACSSGGGSSSKKQKKDDDKEEQEDHSADFLVGEWARISTASYFGGTKIMQVEYFELKDNGKFEHGKWKYSKKDNTLSLNGPGGALIQVDGQVAPQLEFTDEWDGWYFRIVEECPVCSNICVGTWEQLTDAPERTTAEFREDGTMTVNGEEHTWKSICGPDAHFIEVSDYGIVRIDPHAAIMSLMDYTFYRNNELTFIEITPDNWTEYFSADFNFNFDMHYHTQKNTYGDEWEQRVVQDVYVWPVLKWGDNLANNDEVEFMGDLNQLMVEYRYEEGMQSFTQDDQGNVIPGEITQEYRDRHTATLYIYERQWYWPDDTNEEGQCINFSGDISRWGERDISQPVAVQIPKRIQRMKGWIAVKDINAIPEPIQPPPEEGNEIGMLCYGDELEIVTADGFTGQKIDPTKTGKVTVINFWGTWSSPSVDQLVYLEQIASQYANQVTVAAVHSLIGNENLANYLTTNFPDSKITFLSDYGDDYGTYYSTIQGNNYYGYPLTLVLDEEGIITHIFDYAASYDELKAAVEEAMN